MQVALVIPPSLVLSDERYFMHLGILSVGSALKDAHVPVEVLDFSGVSNYLDALETYMKKNDNAMFGITATSPQMPAAASIIEHIRTLNPKQKIIFGGPHVTLANAAAKRELKRGEHGRATRSLEQVQNRSDVVVAGDGELAILEAIKPNAPHLIDADDRGSPWFLSPEKLAQLPFPARHLVDVESYHYTINNVRALSMIAQLGCPYPCGFCGGRYSPFLRTTRTRPIARVTAEMRHLYETYGIRAIMFYDDEMNINNELVIELMNAIENLGKELGIEFIIRGFVKSNLFNDRQAEVMRRAGFVELLIGFESGSPRILKNINKRATKEENTRCFEIARRHDQRIKALMSIGHPGETETTIRETKEWLLEMKPEAFDLTRITVYQGTPYFDDAVPHPVKPGIWIYTAQNGDRLYSPEVDCLKDYMYYKGDKGDRAGLNKFFAYTDELSQNDLARLRDETERVVREKLNQPYQTDAPALLYEHSMGQGLPEYILKSSKKA